MSAARPLVDIAGRPRSPATVPGFHAGSAPRNKGQRYPADRRWDRRGHATTGTYLQGISSEEIISTVHARRAPMMHASAGLDL